MNAHTESEVTITRVIMTDVTMDEVSMTGLGREKSDLSIREPFAEFLGTLVVSRLYAS